MNINEEIEWTGRKFRETRGCIWNSERAALVTEVSEEQEKEQETLSASSDKDSCYILRAMYKNFISM